LIYLYLSTRTWALDSALIRWHTCCEYSHCGFYDSDRMAFYSAQLRGGVRWRSRGGRGDNRETNSRVLLLSAPGADAALAWALTQQGKKYDYSAIFGIALDRNWREEDSWYCSELVAASFEKIGQPLFNPAFQLWRVVPRDLLLAMGLLPVNRKAALTLAPLVVGR